MLFYICIMKATVGYAYYFTECDHFRNLFLNKQLNREI